MSVVRLLVIALVLANLALLGWHLAERGAAPPPAEPTVEVPEIPASAQRIVLLSEMPPPPEGSEQAFCFAVGPFETIASRERAREHLLPVAEFITERESEALIELGYWVTLPPFEDFAAAGGAMRQLNQAGLQDTAVVSDETGEYRVSLGYFLEQSNARRRRDHARSLDFEADIRLQRESQPRYWLDYKALQGLNSPGEAPEGIPPGQHRAIACLLEGLSS